MLARMWRKKKTCPLLVAFQAGTTTLEIILVVPQKLDIVLPEDPTIPLLGIYPEDALTCKKDKCSTMFPAALFILTRSWKDPRCTSTEEWIQKMWYIYAMGYYTALFCFVLFCFCCFFFVFCFLGFFWGEGFETWFLCISLAVPWNSLCRPGCPQTQKSACFCLPNAGIKGVHHHTRLVFLNKHFQFILFSKIHNIWFIHTDFFLSAKIRVQISI